MKTIDVFTFNGEHDLLEMRLNILDKYVDQFIIVEAKTTFSGHKKQLHFSKQENRYKKWWPKIKYYVLDEDYSPEEIALAENSPNTKGAEHWKTEFLQKESIKKALKHLDDDDIVYVGDVDEIWEPHYITISPAEKLLLDVYAYYLNNHSNEVFWGTVLTTWGYLKDKCLNHVRTDPDLRGRDYGGWHFTSIGGLEEVRRKLNDSYTPQSYNTAEVQRLLPKRLETNQDYLGRPFTFKVDESNWPTYLKTNRRKYAKLCK